MGRGGMGVSCLHSVVKPSTPANEDDQGRRCPKASKCGSRTKAHKGISAGPNGPNTKHRIQSIPTPHSLWPLTGYNGFCGSCSTPFIEPQTSKFSSQLSA